MRLFSEDDGPLYVRDDHADPDKGVQELPPFIAREGAEAFSVWSLIEREDGRNQWAYLAHPLHVRRAEHGSADASPAGLPAGWKQARFRPAAGFLSPPEIAVQSNARASGSVLTDRDGMTLYLYRGDVAAAERECTGACNRDWTPVLAAALAHPIGSFRPVDRQDGLRQWEYGGAALFTSSRDVAPQDTNGIEDAPAAWRVALIERYYLPQEIRIRTVFPFGAILTTSDGLPLYTRNRMEGNLQTSVNIRGAFRQKYETGKAIGTGGCDAECLETWHPLEAPPGAGASGFWEVATRLDGRRQWVYKGFALYTHAKDRPGLVTGNNRYDPDEGDQGRYKASDFPPAIRSERTGAYYWHVAEADL